MANPRWQIQVGGYFDVRDVVVANDNQPIFMHKYLIRQAKSLWLYIES